MDADIVVFGGTGDLSVRKLLPALFRADAEDALGVAARIIVCARTQLQEGHLQQTVRDALEAHLTAGEFNESTWQRFRRRLRARAIDITETDRRWRHLAQLLNERPDKTRLFYLAIPPHLYESASANLDALGLITPQSRVVLEKPIGYDLSSANAINAGVARHFSEEQIYRIDHYLGKETVQNLLALRFSNTLFEEMWDGKKIHHIQITVAETVGVEGRADFYDKVGAMRDMVQNHLLQLVALIAMEPPNRMDPQSVRAEKLKVMQALRPIDADNATQHTVRGQYGPGTINGGDAPGYRDELGDDSDTETFLALRAHVDNWRWSSVPFFLRTGKRLPRRYAEICIQYRPVSHRVYDADAGELHPNRLVIRLQPEESIKLTLMAKAMNVNSMKLQPETLNLSFADSQSGIRSNAYKRLLLDAGKGNPTLFTHRDEVEAAWRWVDPILEAWRSGEHPLYIYPAGTWGPPAADELLQANGCHWYNPESL